MKTRIDILSGFLGVGKTTLILKLLESPPAGEKLAICENEYGQVGIDGDTLKGQGLEVMEVNAGCICCTLSLNLITGLKLLIAQHKPDRILLEPTGLANLAEIRKILSDESLMNVAVVGTPAAVLDGSKLLRLHENYETYLNAQIASAEVLFLNRAEGLLNEERDEILSLIASLNPGARILSEPFDSAEAWEALNKPGASSDGEWPELPKAWLSSFKQVAVDTGWNGSRERLEAFAARPEAQRLVRAKGHVHDQRGARWRVDYAGNQWTYHMADSSGADSLQMIGRNLHTQLIKDYFKY